MARLTGPADHMLEVEPVAYQFPQYQFGDDGNWLMIRMSATIGTQHWSATYPVFLTWELRDLARWLRAIADDVLGIRDIFGGIEPNLNFEAEGRGDTTRWRVYFEQEFRPPDLPNHPRSHDSEDANDFLPGPAVAVVFLPDVAALREFAAQLDEALVRFPIRGAAPRSYLDEQRNDDQDVVDG